MSVLVIAQHAHGLVNDITRELVTAGAQIGPVTVALVAAEPQQLVAQVNVSGVSEIVLMRAETDAFEPDTYQRAVVAVIEDRRPVTTLVPFTIDGIAYGPAVAAQLGFGFASDVHGVRVDANSVVATRSFFGGRVHAELEFPGTESVVLSLRAGVWPAAASGGGASVSELELPSGPSRVRHLEYVESQGAADADIANTAFLLAIGRAVEDAEGVMRFRGLADQVGATLVSSRPLVDQGLMPPSRQIGQSGKTVKPKVYLAFGISGAIQHLAGIKSAGTVVAVNHDPEAPIFEVADFAVVADIFDVAEELAKIW